MSRQNKTSPFTPDNTPAPIFTMFCERVGVPGWASTTAYVNDYEDFKKFKTEKRGIEAVREWATGRGLLPGNTPIQSVHGSRNEAEDARADVIVECSSGEELAFE